MKLREKGRIMSEIVYLSLGSNIGDRESNIAGAITALGTYSEIYKIQSASFYETEPLFNQDQPKFLNTVVFCSTEFSPFQFLDAVKNIEIMLGRPKIHKKNLPRTIDIDILCFGDKIIETEALTLPHPELHNRLFVLVPFTELDPDFVLPLWNKTIADLLISCPDNTVITKHIIQTNA